MEEEEPPVILGLSVEPGSKGGVESRTPVLGDCGGVSGASGAKGGPGFAGGFGGGGGGTKSLPAAFTMLKPSNGRINLGKGGREGPVNPDAFKVGTGGMLR